MKNRGKVMPMAMASTLYGLVPIAFSLFATLSIAPGDRKDPAIASRWLVLYLVDHVVFFLVLPLVATFSALLASRLGRPWAGLPGMLVTMVMWKLAVAPIHFVEVVASLGLQATLYWVVAGAVHLQPGERPPTPTA